MGHQFGYVQISMLITIFNNNSIFDIHKIHCLSTKCDAGRECESNTCIVPSTKENKSFQVSQPVDDNETNCIRACFGDYCGCLHWCGENSLCQPLHEVCQQNSDNSIKLCNSRNNCRNLEKCDQSSCGSLCQGSLNLLG